jgi:hypothetical protein
MIACECADYALGPFALPRQIERTGSELLLARKIQKRREYRPFGGFARGNDLGDGQRERRREGWSGLIDRGKRDRGIGRAKIDADNISSHDESC